MDFIAVGIHGTNDVKWFNIIFAIQEHTWRIKYQPQPDHNNKRVHTYSASVNYEINAAKKVSKKQACVAKLHFHIKLLNTTSTSTPPLSPIPRFHLLQKLSFAAPFLCPRFASCSIHSG